MNPPVVCRRLMPGRRQGVGPTSGFTLVEVLVALSAFALLAAAGVALLSWSADQQSTVRARLDRLAELQRAVGLLRSDLSQALPRRVREADGRAARAAFQAAPVTTPSETDLFTFVRAGWENPDNVPRPSLQRVRYRLHRGRLERLAFAAIDGGRKGEPQVLLTDIERVQVRYFDRHRWSDGWGGGITRLPRAVELDLQLRDLGRVRQVFLLPEPAP